MSKNDVQKDSNSTVPEPRKHAKGGSLTNLPSQDEMERFQREEKPKLIAGIRSAWAKNMRTARAQGDRILYVDKGG